MNSLPRTIPRVTEIKPVGNIVLSSKNNVINPDINLMQPISASKKMNIIAFPAGANSGSGFIVNFDSSLNNYIGYELQAADRKGRVHFSGKVGSGNSVNLSEVPVTGRVALQSRLTWQLAAPDQPTLLIVATPIRVFRAPASDYALNTKALPVEVLSQLDAATKDLVDQVFNGNPPRYDTMHGRTYFTAFSDFDDITLLYHAYLAAANLPGAVLNCYDAASVLQYLLQQNGTAAQFCFLKPFGFLRQTALIGRGPCNNPFYQWSGGNPVVNPADPNRTSFGNHAFVSLTGIQCIADACAGPHEGADTEQSYIAAAIDDQIPPGSGVISGTVADIRKYIGVTSVQTLGSAANLAALPHTTAVSELFDWTSADTLAKSPSGVVAKWPEPSKYKGLKEEWKIVYTQTLPGSSEVIRYWLMSNGKAIMAIKLFVNSGDKNSSKSRFIASCSLTEKETHGLIANQLPAGLYAASDSNDPRLFSCWLLENVVMEFICSQPSDDLPALSQWYHEIAANGRVDDLNPFMPAADLIHTAGLLNPGDHFHITLNSKQNMRLDFRAVQKAPILVFQQDKQLIFKAKSPFKGTIETQTLDMDTLLLTQRNVPVTVNK
jgi:hypothetical protein